jgi:uncharacterized protein with PIN domain
MNTAWFRFYEELNDFLPSARKKQSFSCSFSGNPSVKDIIESLGVPHTEIDLILVNGSSVDFTYKLVNEDNVSVYPVFESIDISELQHLRPMPLRDPKFILDVHLGKLSKYLRLCGFDTLYDKDYNDKEIIDISTSDRRIILTRDKGLLKNKQVTHGYWIRSTRSDEQLFEVNKRFDLKNVLKPFTRCLECNTILEDVNKEAIADNLMPKTRKYYSDFKKCPGCNRIFWEGSHYEKMKIIIENILNVYS